MNPKGLFFIVFLFVLTSAECQTQSDVCFKINMSKAMACGLFLPLENDTLLIRGSFNEWTGKEYILEDRNKDSIYENTFKISSGSEKIHEFKYLIIKSNGKELWEKCPNKNNLPSGNRFLNSVDIRTTNFDFDPYYLGVIGKEVIFSVEEIREDFVQFRNTLENQHCCLYEYTGVQEFNNLFDSQCRLLSTPMSPIEFFKILTPITAKIGCGHTAVWMPGGFWEGGENNLFPLKIRLIEDVVVIDEGYGNNTNIEKGSILEEINGVPIADIINEMQVNYSADAMNIHFINSQIERRFSLIYARRFGFKNKFEIKYIPYGKVTSETRELEPSSNSAVRSVVFMNFNHPPLRMEIINENTAVMIIPTFIYYDRVPYFTEFIDSCFTVIHNKKVSNLILDLRGNDGGDPFCAAHLFSYMQIKSEPYFSKPYGKYTELAKPIPLPENHFTGNLYTIIDGRCFSTNGHFCSLLKYHKIGLFIGTESGGTYTCNAGKNGIEKLHNTGIQLYFGRSSFSTAVEGMDKSKPIIPDYHVKETLSDLINGKDVQMEFIFELIDK